MKPILIILSIAAIFIFFEPTKDVSVWNCVEEKLDECVFDHASSELFGHGYYVFKIYDEDGSIICTIDLDEKFHDATVFAGDYYNIIVGSSINYGKSKKVYKELIKRVPEELIYDPHKDPMTQEYIIDKLSKRQ